MKTFPRMALSVVLLLVISGCAKTPNPLDDADERVGFHEIGRMAILNMAGTYKVEFRFQETLSLRPDGKRGEPYETSAEELVVVAEDRGDFISLQHILLVRHGGEAHVINHWRQDWQFEGTRGYAYTGQADSSDRTWNPVTYAEDQAKHAWVQTVYNVDHSPRYSSIGRWLLEGEVLSWTGSVVQRPLPLREKAREKEYKYLASVNTHAVTEKGWAHYQHNQKVNLLPSLKHTEVRALELGANTYTRVKDEGFDKAHEYWKNTQAYWAQVRAVWDEVYAKGEPIALREKWKGDPMYAHLFGLADEYWGVKDASEARPKIEKVIRAFLVEDKK